MSAPALLPALRPDLQIHPGATLPSGEPGWVIHDPVRHRFFQNGREALDMLASWRSGSVDELIADMRRRGAREPSPDAVADLTRFLTAMSSPSNPGGSEARRAGPLASASLARGPRPQLSLLHHSPRPAAALPRWEPLDRIVAVLAAVARHLRRARRLRSRARRPPLDMVVSTGIGFLNLEGRWPTASRSRR